MQDSWTAIVSYYNYTHTCKHKVMKVRNAHTTIHYRQDMVPRLLSDSVYMLAVGALYVCIRLMNSIVLGSPSIASCMYPPPHGTCKCSTECPSEGERESSVTRNTNNCIQTHSCCAHGRTILVEYKDMFLTIYGQWLLMAIIMYVSIPLSPRFLFLMMYSLDVTTPLLPSASVQDSQRPPCLEVVQSGLVKLVTNNLNSQRPLCSN